MRHLWSLLLALVLTPLIYAGAGVCAVRLADARGFGTAAGVGLGAGLLAGGLFAALVMVRLSPVGPLIAGLVYLGVTVYALLDRDGFESLIPPDLFGEDGALHRPVGMGTALLAVPLILTVVSARRWRGSDQAAGLYDPATYAPSAALTYGDADTAASPPPSYASSTLGSATPTYEPPVYTPPSSAYTYGPGDTTQR